MKKLFIFAFIITVTALYSCKKNSETSLSVPFEKYTLSNGLTVILNVDNSDPIAAVAILFHVGSSREVPGRTGFAHLFEHMMFQKSENVGEDQLFKMIQSAGGTLNGGTNQDNTSYFEVVPKNALEMVFWLESDRMGYLENTVTKDAFINQQNIVQNEKRQNYDNRPYGFNRMLIAKTLYPQGHPYSWLTIGEMQDLANATVDDVKSFHHKFYTPNNAILVVSGDINIPEVKQLIDKYFGEIPRGVEIEKREPMPVTLSSTVKLFHEDNLAKTPQFTMVFPTVEEYSKDAYALDYLGQLLSNGKKTPLYTILVKEKKLTSSAGAYNGPQELAGAFNISINANSGVSLADVEKSIFEAFDKFEKEGFTETDLEMIRARNETYFYNNFSSILNKAFSLGSYEMTTGNPEFYKEDFARTQAVTMDDVKAVYNKYIKGKNYIATSFVPKGETNLVAEGSVDANIAEEDVTKAVEVKAEAVAEEEIVKTPTKFDRSVQPALGPDPEIKLPLVWTSSLPNGIKIWGIVQNELPLVEYQLVIDGGQLYDEVSKAGVASLTAASMNEGTKNKTPEELEDAIRLLGANISVYGGTENISIRVSTLAKNFEKTLALVEEILLEPRWDEEQFALAKSRTINNLKRSKANPTYLANSELNKLIYGESNILAVESSGTEVTVEGITTDDLKGYYGKYLTPQNSRFLVAGNIEQARVEAALASLNEKWSVKDVPAPVIINPVAPEKSSIYFIDIPDAKQSAIYIGAPSIARTDPDYYPLQVANTKLGGDFNSQFNMILREEKGFTYGANSYLSALKNSGKFIAASTVRTNSTLESVMIFKTEMEKYRETMPQEYIDYTRSTLLKSNARRFETLGSLLGMISTMSAYNLPADYIKQEEAYVRALTPEKQLEYVRKYLDPAKMYFVIAGDAKTQLKELEKAGLGKPILVK
ncbi:MAG: pitrilysin family protein [Bacteroidia bacterium]|nr:pitrilysin family protein [Bacteroidia bacterium]